MKKKFSMPIKYEQQQFTDDRFLKLKIYVMHEGVNLNESNFDMDSIERAKNSIRNVPILAFVKETDGDNEKDFAGHELELIFKDDEYKFKYLGRPIGVIPADDNNYRYETIDDKNYVVVDGYVWKDYANDALDILQNDEVKNQSMEITVDNYSFSEDGICNITDYKYTGVCLLGDDVIPAMTHARAEVITQQVFNKSKLKEAISDILTELKYSLNENGEQLEPVIEGGKEMNEDKEKELNEQQHENTDNQEIDKEVINEVFEVNKNPEITNELEPISTFSFTSEQLEDELRRLLGKEKITDDWGWEYSSYWYVDHLPEQSVVIAYDCEDGFMVGFNYTVQDDLVTVDMSNEQRYKIEYVPMKLDPEVETDIVSNREDFSFVPAELYNHYKESKKEDESIKSQFSTLETELNELRQYKAGILAEERVSEETQIFDNFSSELTEDEMKPIKEKASEYSLEELEDKLFALAGRKKVKFSTTQKKERISMGIFENHEEKQSEKDVWTEQKEKFGSDK